MGHSVGEGRAACQACGRLYSEARTRWLCPLPREQVTLSPDLSPVSDSDSRSRSEDGALSRYAGAICPAVMGRSHTAKVFAGVSCFIFHFPR